ncbi:helix-turn-helix transcriptional regulator [Kitasatospora sp. NPDC050463]|uniref:helix-turn-helix transcriptional regulator n=1 Tax=Kitasatospora sp. NPDC050463 TaxID=3155786 RepID=UPI0033DC74CD
MNARSLQASSRTSRTRAEAAEASTSSRELDRILRDRDAVLVQFAALDDLPRTAPELLSAGLARTPTAPAALLRLLYRARSLPIPCVLVAPVLDQDLECRLTALRVPGLWSAAVSAVEHLTAGTNPFRAAATQVNVDTTRCLAVAHPAAIGSAAASGASVVISSSGSIERRAVADRALTELERAVALLIALGHTGESAAKILKKSRSTVATTAVRLNKRYGFQDRSHTLARLITDGLLDTAPLRDALPSQLPALEPLELEAVTLLAGNDLPATARIMKIPERAVERLLKQAAGRWGTTNRTHTITVALATDAIPTAAARPDAAQQRGGP